MSRFFESLWRDPAFEFHPRGIEWPKDRITDIQPGETIPPGSCYLHGWLEAIYLPWSRRGFKKVYATLHSSASIPVGGAASAEHGGFLCCVTPADLKGVDSGSLAKVIVRNIRLFGPIPYNGGDLKLQIGLFCSQAQDLLEPYLSLLQKASDVAGVSLLSQAAPVLPILRSGMDLLTGAKDVHSLEVGYRADIQAPRVQSHAIIADKPSSSASVLRLGDDGFLFEGAARVGKPYFVYSISGTKTRSDWMSIQELREAHQALSDAVRNGDVGRAEDALAAFRRITLFNQDLLMIDRKRVFEEVETEVRTVLGGFKRSGSKPVGAAALTSLAAVAEKLQKWRTSAGSGPE